MYNYRPPISDEEIDYLITYGTKEEIDEANERIISDMDDYCEYLVRMEEKKRIRKCNWFLLIHIEFSIAEQSQNMTPIF